MDAETILTNERIRIGDMLMKVARRQGWCDDIQKAWRLIYPDHEWVNAEGLTWEQYDQQFMDRDNPPGSSGWFWCCDTCGWRVD